MSMCLKEGNEAFCWRVGNGRTTMFWVDIWCGNCPLKLEFPRLFRLVRKKGGMVANYSRNNVFNRVKWSELFTRSLLEREEEMLCRSEDKVNSIELVPGVEDRLCWVHNSNGEFTVRKCYELLIINGGDDIIFAFDKIWKLKVPPRVRSFLWMLAIDRIPTKEFLVKIGREQTICSSNANLLKDSGIKFSISGRLNGNRLWLISISAACWAVWLARNGLVFEIKMMTMETLIFQSKMRALLWLRTVYDDLLMQESYWWICLNRLWRCFEIIQDVARALFSSPIAANGADSVEAGAVVLALEVFISLEWKINDSLFAEICSKVVFNWCANKPMRPWSLQSTFADIERKIDKVGSVVFLMAEKKGNKMVSTLAIAGINHGDMFKAWW
ncbi:hypothetical protein Gotur_007672 [Gossypium turneri]